MAGLTFFNSDLLGSADEAIWTLVEVAKTPVSYPKKDGTEGKYHLATFTIGSGADEAQIQGKMNTHTANWRHRKQDGSEVKFVDAPSGSRWMVRPSKNNPDFVDFSPCPSEPETFQSSASHNKKQMEEEKETVKTISDYDLKDKIKNRCMAQAGAAQAYITGSLSIRDEILFEESDPLFFERIIKEAVNFGVKFADANLERATKEVSQSQ